MISFDDIQRILACHKPMLIDGHGVTRAAVALILRPGETGLEVLFIERATHPGDPWSGDLGFPGGKVEERDGDPRQTAERETLEEIGLDLGGARCLGRLSDIAGAHTPVRVSCLVYGVEDLSLLVLSGEVRDAFWVSLADLVSPQRHFTSPVRFKGETFERPAISLPHTGKPVLWGLTYRLVMHFLDLLREGKLIAG